MSSRWKIIFIGACKPQPIPVHELLMASISIYICIKNARHCDESAEFPPNSSPTFNMMFDNSQKSKILTEII